MVREAQACQSVPETSQTNTGVIVVRMYEKIMRVLFLKIGFESKGAFNFHVGRLDYIFVLSVCLPACVSLCALLSVRATTFE